TRSSASPRSADRGRPRSGLGPQEMERGELRLTPSPPAAGRGGGEGRLGEAPPTSSLRNRKPARAFGEDSSPKPEARSPGRGLPRPTAASSRSPAPTVPV